MATMQLKRVEFIPKDILPGILYVSDRYRISGHICPCGCGNKVMLPLGPAEWSLKEVQGKPSLWPSVSSGQLPCNSHYVINEGGVVWYRSLTEQAVLAGRQAEEARREKVFADQRRQKGLSWRFWNWLSRLFS